jgi:REP element-mobilizing transposase RayT
MTLFKDKYRSESARCVNWDYSSPGYYFVTLCTQNRECIFSTIFQGKMELSAMGKIARQMWFEIPNHFQIAMLDEFVVMPNHVHGIIQIIQNPKNDGITMDDDNGYHMDSDDNCGYAINRVSTIITSIPPPTPRQPHSKTGGITGKHNPMLHENLSRIVRWYKGRCTFEIRKIQSGFQWQSRFYDHIIRNEESYKRIVKYIRNNPEKWNLEE